MVDGVVADLTHAQAFAHPLQVLAVEHVGVLVTQEGRRPTVSQQPQDAAACGAVQVGAGAQIGEGELSHGQTAVGLFRLHLFHVEGAGRLLVPKGTLLPLSFAAEFDDPPAIGPTRHTHGVLL